MTTTETVSSWTLMPDDGPDIEFDGVCIATHDAHALADCSVQVDIYRTTGGALVGSVDFDGGMDEPDQCFVVRENSPEILMDALMRTSCSILPEANDSVRDTIDTAVRRAVFAAMRQAGMAPKMRIA